MVRLQIVIVVAALVAIALSIFAYKVFELGFPTQPDQDQSEFYVEARISFTGGRGPVSVEAAVPASASRFVVLETDALATGFGVLEQSSDEGESMLFEQRSAPGPQTVFYRVRGYRIDSSNVPRSQGNRPDVASPFSTDLRERALRNEPTPFLVALDEVISLAQSRSADDRNFVRNLALILSDARDERVETIVEDAELDLRESERRLVTILNAAEIPARRVVGLIVRGEERTVTPRAAVEVYLDEQWRRVSPRTGRVDDEDAFKIGRAHV